MKDLLKISGIFAFLVIAIPMIGFAARDSAVPEPDEGASETEVTSTTETASAVSDISLEEFSVLDYTTGQVMTMTMTEYVIGAVLGEMPAAYGEEALKAQAVAAHTYAVRRILCQEETPDPELMGAYISNDSSKYQAYFSPEQAKAFYGSAYEEYEEKVSKAVDEVIDCVLVYDGEPIVAAFHSISGGKTESAEAIWGTAVDYLVPVESEYDEEAPTFYSESVFTYEELSARLTQSDYGITLPEEKEGWLEIIETTESGTVSAVNVGDKTMTGMELRTLLNLKSPVFEVSYDKEGDSFTFSVKGSGHGVGMSQYGAGKMAENGSDYKEILEYYYPGAEVVGIGDIIQ